MRIYLIFATALIPLFVGALWYHPKTFGNTWMQIAEISEDKIKNSNMALIFGLTYGFGVLASFMLGTIVVHQTHIYSILLEEPGYGNPSSELGLYLSDFMEKYGQNYRTFKHGALHGTIAGICFATPVLGINALFERRGFKYIALHGSFWVVSLALMGGVLCQWM